MAEFFARDMAPAPMTLLQFTTNISNAIRVRPDLRDVWVTAEMQDLRESGGHCYMELIEKNEGGQTVAKIRAMIWRSTLDGLQRKFNSATGRDIASGLKVMVKVTANHHPNYGLSATISDIDPTYTLGDLERLRREILEKLRREGILDLNKSKKMPKAPQKLAVISAAGAAGYGDFINQLEGNTAGFKFYPCLFGATMQGERTPGSVMEALQRVEMTIDLWDCVVIIRGGGSTTDMNGFDDYELARAVATFPLPVIVGIGHERDRCVLDEIACVRCKTPTAAAGYLIERLGEAWSDADRVTRAIVQYSTDRLAGEKQRLGQASVAISPASLGCLERHSLRLGRLGEALPLLVGRITDGVRSRLSTDLKLIESAATAATARGRERLPLIAERIGEAALTRIASHRDRLESAGRLCAAYSPANTLKRGYSVTMVDGKAVTDPGQLKPGMKLETRLKGGTVTSIVSEEKIIQKPNTP